MKLVRFLRTHIELMIELLLIYNISHKLLRPSQFRKKIIEILEWSTLQK